MAKSIGNTFFIIFSRTCSKDPSRIAADFHSLRTICCGLSRFLRRVRVHNSFVAKLKFFRKMGLVVGVPIHLFARADGTVYTPLSISPWRSSADRSKRSEKLVYRTISLLSQLTIGISPWSSTSLVSKMSPVSQWS